MSKVAADALRALSVAGFLCLLALVGFGKVSPVWALLGGPGLFLADRGLKRVSSDRADA